MSCCCVRGRLADQDFQKGFPISLNQGSGAQQPDVDQLYSHAYTLYTKINGLLF